MYVMTNLTTIRKFSQAIVLSSGMQVERSFTKPPRLLDGRRRAHSARPQLRSMRWQHNRRQTGRAYSTEPGSRPPIVILCPASKSVTSHRRREAASKKWLVEDIRNLRLKGVEISSRSSFARTLLKMGREHGKLNGSRSDPRLLPGRKLSERVTTTWQTSTRRTSASAGPSCSGTLLESMNVMFWQPRPVPRGTGARAC